MLSLVSPALLALLAFGAVADPQSVQVSTSSSNVVGNVTTWSVQTNTPAWNADLGVTGTRQGCSDTPAGCISFVKKVARREVQPSHA